MEGWVQSFVSFRGKRDGYHKADSSLPLTFWRITLGKFKENVSFQYDHDDPEPLLYLILLHLIVSSSSTKHLPIIKREIEWNGLERMSIVFRPHFLVFIICNSIYCVPTLSFVSLSEWSRMNSNGRATGWHFCQHFGEKIPIDDVSNGIALPSSQ